MPTASRTLELIPELIDARAALGTLLSWPSADPDDSLDYAIDPSKSAPDDDTLLPGACRVSAPGLTVNRVTVAARMLSFWLAGGVNGQDYTVAFVLGFTSGRRLHGQATLPVRSHGMLPDLPGIPAQLTFNGTGLTFNGVPLLFGAYTGDSA